MRKKYALLLLMVLRVTVGISQDSGVQSFKFSSIVDSYDFPATESTGIISPQLPLFEITTKELHLPVSLIYNMIGNSNVFYIGNQFGDAWNLNIQGTIQRQSTLGLITETNETVAAGYECGSNHVFSILAKKITQNPVVPDEKYFHNNPNATTNPRKDSFTFSVNGLEGKFTLYKEGGHLKAEIYESSDYVTIEIFQNQSGENISKIVITDKNGLKYHFEEPGNIDYNAWYESIILLESLSIPEGCNGILEQGYSGSPFSNQYIADNQSGFTNYSAGAVFARRVYPSSYHYWMNLELTRIVDKNNTTLVSYEYETVHINAINSETVWVDGIGKTSAKDKKFLKKIKIANQGSVDFTNVISNGINPMTVVTSYTSGLEIKNLTEDLVKKMEFNYVVRNVNGGLHHIGRTPNNGSGLFFRKRLLTEIKTIELNTTNSTSTKIEYKDPTITLQGGDNPNVVANIYGDLMFYKDCTTTVHFRKEEYIGDSYLLQKIQYPTGGSVIYKFEPNTFSYGNQNLFNLSDNEDDVSYQQIPITGVDNNTFRFSAHTGDHIYVINLDYQSNLSLYKTTQITQNNLLINIIKTKSNGFFIRESFCKHNLSNIVLPVTVNNLYTLKSEQNSSVNKIKVYKRIVSANTSNFRYTEGNRIAKIAYFEHNVSKNILETENGENQAEKVVTYNYQGETSNSSSGHISSQISNYEGNFIAYDKINVAIKNIGNKVFEFDIPDSYYKITRRDLEKETTYSLSGALISENEHNYTYNQPAINAFVNPIDIKPYIKSHSVTQRSFEGAGYTEKSHTTLVSDSHRQPEYTLEETPGHVVKILPSYALLNNTLVNTHTDTYINGVLDRINKNTFDANGNFLKSEFKKPDTNMYDFEPYGKEITRMTNGRVEEYRLPNHLCVADMGTKQKQSGCGVIRDALSGYIKFQYF